jgi:PKD repeat protein
VYSVRAEQADEGGNLGVSSPTTFSVLGPAAAGPIGGPAASFSWIPAAPHAGERVSLLSSSTDLASPIVAYAWDLAGNGAFAAGGPVNTTSFSTPGKHVVQLRVTDANGGSSVAAETIDVGSASLPLMQPFPTVRITATRRRAGTRLKLLSVRTSAGARVTVTCRGRGCPIKSQSRLAAAGSVGAAPIEFRRFERSLRAGVVLEIRVTRAGQIGKYTRFSIRRGRLPARADACLAPASGTPIPCPAS